MHHAFIFYLNHNFYFLFFRHSQGTIFCITLPFLSLPQKDLFCCSWATNLKFFSQLLRETRATVFLVNCFSPGPEWGYRGQPHRPRPRLPGGGQQHAECSPNQLAPLHHSPRRQALLPGHLGLPPGWSWYAHLTSDISQALVTKTAFLHWYNILQLSTITIV